eukprot:TRINITY_DN31022_c0_g1_i1.p1 TRINITY_DN31022_c0_g1~~TRINITY_DN31022_c0_g1_i1.p1  ORF type:complete len:659 (+),score=130.28 TRINITY_DN31022_c0_g1_i1:55-2031(+)
MSGLRLRTDLAAFSAALWRRAASSAAFVYVLCNAATTLAAPTKLISEVNVNVTSNQTSNATRTDDQMYGFYLHVYREPAATLNQLRAINQFYPGAPVYIMSDGGFNYSQACSLVAEGQCRSEWRPPAHDCWNPKPFLERFREGAEWLKTEYVIMLEPDVTLHKRSSIRPKYDAAGLADVWNPQLRPALRQHLQELGRKVRPNYTLEWPHFGLAGGTILRSAAVLDAFWPDRVDWKKMAALAEDKLVYSSDVAMAIVMAQHGYTYGPWGDVTTGPKGQSARYPNGTFMPGPFLSGAFQHHGADEVAGKPLYNKDPTQEEWKLIKNPPPGAQDLYCQACVWVSDKDCKGNSCPVSQPSIGVSLIDLPFVERKPSEVQKRRGDLLAARGGSGKLVATALIQDPQATWGSAFGAGGVYPAWVKQLMRVNVRHVGDNGHSMAIRTELSSTPSDFSKLAAAWEKYQMLLDYLESGDYSHVLFVDADSMFVRKDADTVSDLAEAMDNRGASILFADEDWRGPEHSGRRAPSASIVMVRATPEAKQLLRRLIAARTTAADPWAPACQSDAKLCLHAVLDGGSSVAALVQTSESEAKSSLVTTVSGARYSASSQRALHGSCEEGADTKATPCVLAEGADIVHFGMEQVSRRTLLGEPTLWGTLCTGD